ncbi:uncharacterized protein BO87DRAFT_442259 [Aspergillus neoniger CBS 115656]|uniref:Rhodopsin domain-containing protein n=1 Tax=Aspergillus neoniger (strain CBS 115656) TaxID=1448310 RepID=A0A318YCA7_ASPNB|nr:hypothetical protein BO87DRAFT_442259 [Aspergillus neoniger CBS 115656]PYH31614.1 hypothetical protein BO87DRAFT_442259 [Aspergillus neoniger CBS 115656]
MPSLASRQVAVIVSFAILNALALMAVVATVNGGVGIPLTQAIASGLSITSVLKATCFRLAILDLYINTFPVQTFCIAAYVLEGIIVLYLIGSIATTLRLCRPLAYYWNPSLEGSCGNALTAELAAAVINMILDIIAVILPVPVIWKLQMATEKKVAVTATFGLGLVISVINLIRLIKVLDCTLDQDLTYCTADSAILTVAEMAVGIMVACAPTFGPVICPSRRRRFAEQEQGLSCSRHASGGRWLLKRSRQNTTASSPSTAEHHPYRQFISVHYDASLAMQSQNSRTGLVQNIHQNKHPSEESMPGDVEQA